MKRVLALLAALALLTACGATTIGDMPTETTLSQEERDAEMAEYKRKTEEEIAQTKAYLRELYADNAELFHRLKDQLWPLTENYDYWNIHRSSDTICACFKEGKYNGPYNFVDYKLSEIDPALRENLITYFDRLQTDARASIWVENHDHLENYRQIGFKFDLNCIIVSIYYTEETAVNERLDDNWYIGVSYYVT